MPVFKANPNDGTTYDRPGGKIDRPKAWLFPMSMNTHKVIMLLEISPIGARTTKRWVDISGVAGDNYTLDYARMNPIMTVPVLEVDDKVITDSYYIYQYLRQHYPGEGDKEVAAAGKDEMMTAFIDAVNDWDEVMYSYGNKGSMPSAVHEIANQMRLVRLRQGYFKASALPDEKVPTGGTLKEAFIHKLAGITYFSGIVGEAMPAAKLEKLNKCKADLRSLFSTAEGLLAANSPSGGCLMGAKPSSADAMFLSVVHRVNGLFSDEARALFAAYPRVGAWFDLMKRTKEAKPMLKMSLRGTAPKFIFKWCFPCRMIAYKLGVIGAPGLPPDAMAAVAREVEEMARLHGTA